MKKLTTQELRIGNYILRDSEWIEVDGYRISKLAMSMPDSYNGIPLTPKILEKCGFVSGQLGSEHLVFIYYGNDNLGIKGMLGMVKPFSIQYLHQLQNLYFALTNTELNIKL